MFNLNAFPSPITIQWSALGFKAAPRVRDLWNHLDLGGYNDRFSAVVLGHGVRLLKVTARGHAQPAYSQAYEAEAATLGGSAAIADCAACSGGAKVGNLGVGVNNTLTFNNIYVDHPGTYQMEIDSMTSGGRDLLFQVNGGSFTSLKVGGGSFTFPRVQPFR